MDSAVIVLTTLAADADATALARTLVEEHLAACVNVLPSMRSVYRWKGKVAEEREQQLLIKTSAARVDALLTRIAALHPYETPELIILNATASDAYCAWLIDSSSPSMS
jgi:periplasmic divalent cation tolerance protein